MKTLTAHMLASLVNFSVDALKSNYMLYSSIIILGTLVTTHAAISMLSHLSCSILPNLVQLQIESHFFAAIKVYEVVLKEENRIKAYHVGLILINYFSQ